MADQFTFNSFIFLSFCFFQPIGCFEWGENPGLITKCFNDTTCDQSPPSCYINSLSGSKLKDCYPGSTPDNPARSFLTVSLDDNWKHCKVSIYSDDDCKTDKTPAPVGKCMVPKHLGSYGFECTNPTSSTINFIDPTKIISPSRSATSSSSKSTSESATPIPQPASTQGSDTGSNAGGGNNGGLNTNGTIAIGVVLPVVSIIIAIIFGIRMWNSGIPHRKSKHPPSASPFNPETHDFPPPKEYDQTSTKRSTSPPAELSDHWLSRATTSYSETPAPMFSPITTELPPNCSQTLSPMSSMRSHHTAYDISRHGSPAHDVSPITGTPLSYLPLKNMPEMAAGSVPRWGAAHDVAELSTEPQRIPELGTGGGR